MGRLRTRRERNVEAVAEFDPLREYERGTAEYYVAFFFHRLRENFRLIVGGGALLVLVAVGLVSYVTIQENRKKEGMVAFEQLLKEPVMKAQGAEKTAAQKLDEFLEKHADASSKDRVAVYRIQYLRKAGDVYQAAEEAMRLARSMETAPLSVYFACLAGYLYEADGKWPESQEAFNLALSNISEDTDVKGLALLGAGRGLLHMGRKADALAAFEKVLELPDSVGADDLRLLAVQYLLIANQ